MKIIDKLKIGFILYSFKCIKSKINTMNFPYLETPSKFYVAF